MAPEQLEGRASHASIDIYALAAVAFEMLSGRKARQESNPVALAHAISTLPPPDLRAAWPSAPPIAAAVLQRGMAVDPAERPQSAGALVARLAEALEPQSTAAATPPWTHARRPGAPAGSAPSPAAVPPARRIPRAQPPADEAERRAPRRPQRARAGAIVALLVGAVLVALAAALGSGGAHRTVKKIAGVGAAQSRRQHSAAVSSQSSGRSSGSVAQRQSTSEAAATKPAGVSAPAGVSSSAPVTPALQTPAAAVEAFYAHAAHHEYASAWALADANMRNQLAGFDSFQAQQSAVRSITFHRAQALAGSGESSRSATVALQTTAVLADRTEQCAGTARLVRAAAERWLLDGISINCTP